MVKAGKIRLMLVDDHPIMRMGLANLLSLDTDMEVVAQADDGPTALALWRKHRPDVTLLDVSMERMDGIETLRRLRADHPDANVLMLTSSKASEDMSLAMQAGARGYLLKTIHHEELAAAICKVHRGEVVTAAIGQPQPKQPGRLLRRWRVTSQSLPIALWTAADPPLEGA